MAELCSICHANGNPGSPCYCKSTDYLPSLIAERDVLKKQVDDGDRHWHEYHATIRANMPEKYTKQPQLDLCMQRMKEDIVRLESDLEKSVNGHTMALDMIDKLQDQRDALQIELAAEKAARERAEQRIIEALRAALEIYGDKELWTYSDETCDPTTAPRCIFQEEHFDGWEVAKEALAADDAAKEKSMTEPWSTLQRDDLKTCPFCGTKAIEQARMAESDTSTQWRIQCGNPFCPTVCRTCICASISSAEQIWQERDGGE